MIDHEQYRRALLADPSPRDPELTAHRNACASCRAYTDRVLGFERRLAQALEVPLTTGADILPFTRRTAPSSRSRRWFALAASVLLSLGVGSAFWLAAPRSTLAAEVVAHMAGEPNAWNTQAPVPGPELAAVLKNANMSLDPRAPAVSYASSCIFRGHIVPHLVVQTSRGPVTVMVLVHERVAKPKDFDEHGYRGTIVPVPNHGSLAVLMRRADATSATVEAIASQVENAIVWGPQAGTVSEAANHQVSAQK
jgi:uncharacterized protein DUF3379